MSDLDIVRARLRHDIARRYSGTEFPPPDDGLWSDVDYAGTQHAEWPPLKHLERLRSMACRPDATEAVLRGIDVWLDLDPRSDNWWYNQIGAPIALGDVLVLVEEFLTDEQRDIGCERLARSVWTDMVAQNLVWAAEGTIRRGLLRADADAVADAFTRVAGTLAVTTGEGVQPDGSFHQHGPLLYFMGYGHDFLVDSARLAYLASGTEFAFDAARIKVLVDYLLDGLRWVIHRSTYDFAAMGRVLARPDAQNAWQEVTTATRQLMRISTYRKDELEALRDRLPNRIRHSGHRHFPRSDFTAHHRPAWSTSIKMCSTRTAPTETGNGEGLLSWYLGEGINPVWVTGEEYRDIFPVWNWRRLPGLTAEQSPGPLPVLFWHRAPDGGDIRGGRAEVGGLAEGGYGLATMRLAKDEIGDGYKAWFCFDDEIVALGAGISAPGAAYPVWTTVNQCLAEGPVEQGPGWVQHGRIRYLFPRGTEPVVRTEPLSGAWSRIGAAQSDEPLRREVTTVAVDHGPRPRDAAYAYLVLPGTVGPRTPRLTILRNDAAVQAVRHDGLGIVQAAFHRAGRLDGMAVDGPALLQIRGDIVSVADHTRRGGTLRIRAAGRERTVRMPGGDAAGGTVRLENRRTPGPSSGYAQTL